MFYLHYFIFLKIYLRNKDKKNIYIIKNVIENIKLIKK